MNDYTIIELRKLFKKTFLILNSIYKIDRIKIKHHYVSTKEYQYALNSQIIYKDNLKNTYQHEILTPFYVYKERDKLIILQNELLEEIYNIFGNIIKTKSYWSFCWKCDSLTANMFLKKGSKYLCEVCEREYINENIDTKNNKYEGGFIYFFQSSLTNLIKIGYSVNPKGRKNQLENAQGGEIKILKYIIGDNQMEVNIQQAFEKYRERGEWFQAADELLEFISKL